MGINEEIKIQLYFLKRWLHNSEVKYALSIKGIKEFGCEKLST